MDYLWSLDHLWSLQNFSVICVLLAIFGWIRYIKICPTVRDKVDLTGKTALVTGGNVGVGKATAIELARRHARVIIGCRNAEKALRAVKDIKECSGNKSVQYMQLDLADLHSVCKFAAEFNAAEERLDILVNNAGVACTGRTVQGFDVMLATNQLGPFLLTHLLLPKLLSTALFAPPTRIVNVCSDAYKLAHIKVDLNNMNPYLHAKTPSLTVFKQYARTKLMNYLFTQELNHRYVDDNVYSFSAEPGCVSSDIGSSAVVERGWKAILPRSLLLTFFGRNPFYGCQTTLYCCIIPHLKPRYNEYYATRFGPGLIKPSWLHHDAMDYDMARKLWIKCEELCGIRKIRKKSTE